MENRAAEMDVRALKHDMRTPIANVIALAQLSMNMLEHEETQESILPYLSKILAAAKELQLLTGEAPGGEKDETFSALDIARMLGATVGVQAAQKNQLLRLDVSELGGAEIKGPRTALMRILSNLLGNAVKYTQAGGRIGLTARWANRQEAEFVVEDNGMGMSDAFMARMYEPFARAPEVDGGEIEGCGLGLSIVRRLTAELGGSIQAASEWGKGTTFTLRLPLRAEQKTDAVLYGKCFLLAEDNELSAEIVQEILTGKGASVRRAGDGEQAIRLFESLPAQTFDAILMDMHMPHLGGCAAAEAIRSHARADAGKIPIFALTAGEDARDECEALAAGMNACLRKPLNVARLCAVIQAAE